MQQRSFNFMAGRLAAGAFVGGLILILGGTHKSDAAELCKKADAKHSDASEVKADAHHFRSPEFDRAPTDDIHSDVSRHHSLLTIHPFANGDESKPSSHQFARIAFDSNASRKDRDAGISSKSAPTIRPSTEIFHSEHSPVEGPIVTSMRNRNQQEFAA